MAAHRTRNLVQATNDGARITQWSRNDGANQQWQFPDQEPT